MKVFTIYNTEGHLNTYLIGSENGGDAILVDPGQIDIYLLDLIEKNNYSLKSILVTHSHKHHIRGIKTLLKIYDADIYSKLSLIHKIETIKIHDGQHLDLSGYDIEIIEIAGHSEDSIVYKVNNILFTGDVLSAGQIGSVSDQKSKKLLQKEIIKKIFSLKNDYVIFPGHGAPTKLGVEKNINPYLNIS